MLTTVTHYEVLGLLSFAPAHPAQSQVAGGDVRSVRRAWRGDPPVRPVLLLPHPQAGSRALARGDSTLENCLYFSAETFTSLGFGDIVPTGSLRLLAGFEALNGLLLIGWSASYIYISMERYWGKDQGAATDRKAFAASDGYISSLRQRSN